MAPDTKEGIKRLVKSYMENPNAIILCIQGMTLYCENFVVFKAGQMVLLAEVIK
jgi:hypothetical protein